MAETSDHIEAALAQLLQERADLDMAITALQRRLGRPVTTPPVAAGAATPSTPSGEVLVYRGEFYGLSIPKAAEKLLKRVGRPLKTPAILDAFERAGYQIKAKMPRANVYTALARGKSFVRVLPDTWALAESHPEAAALKEETARYKKPRKAKRRSRPNVRQVEKGTPEANVKTVA